MSQPLEQMEETPTVSCGRSWEGLVDRRHAAFQHAFALRNASSANSGQAVSDFLAFFDDIGIGLFRDEEEWIFRELRPAPTAVLDAVEGHIEICALIGALLREVETDQVALGVVQHLGELLETHLLLEEAELRPVFDGSQAALQRV